MTLHGLHEHDGIGVVGDRGDAGDLGDNACPDDCEFGNVLEDDEPEDLLDPAPKQKRKTNPSRTA